MILSPSAWPPVGLKKPATIGGLACRNRCASLRFCLQEHYPPILDQVPLNGLPYQKACSNTQGQSHCTTWPVERRKPSRSVMGEIRDFLNRLVNDFGFVIFAAGDP
jgi:hypothetical protein